MFVLKGSKKGSGKQTLKIIKVFLVTFFLLMLHFCLCKGTIKNKTKRTGILRGRPQAQGRMGFRKPK